MHRFSSPGPHTGRGAACTTGWMYTAQGDCILDLEPDAVRIEQVAHITNVDKSAVTDLITQSAVSFGVQDIPPASGILFRRPRRRPRELPSAAPAAHLGSSWVLVCMSQKHKGQAERLVRWILVTGLWKRKRKKNLSRRVDLAKYQVWQHGHETKKTEICLPRVSAVQCKLGKWRHRRPGFALLGTVSEPNIFD